MTPTWIVTFAGSSHGRLFTDHALALAYAAEFEAKGYTMEIRKVVP